MPNPREDETREAFMSRCMGHSEARSSFPGEDQRAAFCHSQWDRRHNMKIASILLSNVATRMEMFDGKQHLIVPVIALIEGVLNGLYYPGVEVVKHPQSWNGIPIVIEHPVDSQGTEVSANTPSILEKVRIGHFFNVGVDGVKLKGEAWINIEKAKEIRPRILEEVHQNLEVSTGLFGDSNNIPGIWEGIDFSGTLTGFKPDHLALLFEGEGACSWQDGCGVRVNMQEESIPFSERSDDEKKKIEDFNKRMTSGDWSFDYMAGLPHWMENDEPSPLAVEMIADLRKKNIMNAKILEIGVGNGRDSIFMAQSGNNVVGIDIVDSAVEAAKLKSNGMGGVSFRLGNAEHLEFHAAEFDAVYSIAALHSTPLRFTLREINRVLKNEGIVKLFLYTATKTGSLWVSYWTPGEIKQFAEEEGFTILKFRETSNSEPIEIPGVEGLVEQESRQVVTTLEKNIVQINKEGGDKMASKDVMVEEALKAAGVEGEKKVGVFKKMLNSFLSNFKANELGHDDIRMQLQEIVDAMDIPREEVSPTLHYVQEVFDDYVIMRQTSGSTSKLFRIGFDVSDDDRVTLKSDRVEVREETDFVPAEVGLGSQKMYVEVNPKKEDSKMGKKKDECCKELIDALIANEASQFTEEDRVWLDELPEDQIKKLSPVEKKEDAKVKAAAEKAEATRVAEAAKKAFDEAIKGGDQIKSDDDKKGDDQEDAITTEEYIEKAPDEMKEVLAAGLAMHKAKKTQLVAGLIANKRNKFTKEQLEAKGVEELEILAELAAVVVDFTTNRPYARASDEDDETIPDAPKIDWKAAAEKK